MGHAQRSCLIGLKIADILKLDVTLKKSLHTALLIKDSGCSSNAARMYEIFGGDEIDAKRLGKIVDWSNILEAAKYAVNCTLPKGSFFERIRQLGKVAQNADIGNQIVEARCSRGAVIAQKIGLSYEASECIRNLDEHWDGKGSPCRLQGDQIPLLARIACLAQTLEVYAKTFDLEIAFEVISKRSGKWFDPEIVKCALSFQNDELFWQTVYGGETLSELLKLDIDSKAEIATDIRIDSVCEAFAQIVDAKSPFTGDHSSRVSQYTVTIAEQFGIDADRLTLLRRAGLLHDIGKLAVPNRILDSPNKLTDDDWVIMKKHPQYSFEILSQIPGFERMAEIAGAHHERLDGRGYYQGLSSDDLDLDQRILAVADVYDALSAERPYRRALSTDEVFAILDKDSGIALDRDCVDAARACTIEYKSNKHDQPDLKLAA
jgi:putative nucleotidyltransferase with HDIG domain